MATSVMGCLTTWAMSFTNCSTIGVPATGTSGLEQLMCVDAVAIRDLPWEQ